MRRGIFVAIALFIVGSLAGTAVAKSAPVTSMRFKIDDHSVSVGEAVQGTVTVASKVKGKPTPIEGATLSVRIGKTEVATVVTDAAGQALVSYVTTDPGEHVIRVVYAGDEAHKRAHRAQGFDAATVVPDPEPTPTPSPEPTPEPEPVG